MDEQFCIVPFWGVPSPEADNVLPDYFAGYDDNNVAKTIARYSNSDSRLSTGCLLSEGQADILEWTLMQSDEGRSSCSLDSESDSGSSYCDGGDISWLNEFMNVYGITTLDSSDDFDIKNTDVAIVTPQVKENHPAFMLAPTREMKSDGFWNDKTTGVDPNISSSAKTSIARKTESIVMTTHSSAINVLHNDVQRKCSIVPPSDYRQKFAMKRTCFNDFNERKREQNRCAAIRYRGKRREEAKQKKQELHELELRNVELKAEMNCLEKEVIYLKSLMKFTKDF